MFIRVCSYKSAFLNVHDSSIIMQNEQQDDQARQRLLQRAHAAERRVQELLLEV